MLLELVARFGDRRPLVPLDLPAGQRLPLVFGLPLAASKLPPNRVRFTIMLPREPSSKVPIFWFRLPFDVLPVFI